MLYLLTLISNFVPKNLNRQTTVYQQVGIFRNLLFPICLKEIIVPMQLKNAAHKFSTSNYQSKNPHKMSYC
jgi:hypothetical protein